MLFSREHLWIESKGDTAKVGLSVYAVEKLGGIVFLNLPEPGEQLKIGEKFGDVESIKTVSDLISLIAGEVLAVNELLLMDPGLISTAPQDSWLIEVKVERLSDQLMTEDAYQKYKDECNV